MLRRELSSVHGHERSTARGQAGRVGAENHQGLSLIDGREPAEHGVGWWRLREGLVGHDTPCLRVGVACADVLEGSAPVVADQKVATRQYCRNQKSADARVSIDVVDDESLELVRTLGVPDQDDPVGVVGP